MFLSPTQVIQLNRKLDRLKAEHTEDSDRNSAMNWWSREETMALLKIKCKMDVAFKDANPKAFLWEQVSRLVPSFVSLFSTKTPFISPYLVIIIIIHIYV